MAVSKAEQKAFRKYQKEKCDNILVRFPKGTKARIQETGDTVNGYINKSVIEKLERDGK